MLGFAVGLPFLLNSLIITQDYFSAAKSVVALFLATVFTLIGTGYFVDKNRGKGFFKLLGRKATPPISTGPRMTANFPSMLKKP